MEGRGSVCDLGLLEAYHRYTGKPRDLFDLCVSHKVILEKKNCETCGKPSTLDFNRKKWRCQQKVVKSPAETGE